MIYFLKCTRCGATTKATGEEEYDTNATVIDYDSIEAWDGGDPDCDHEDHEITDSEYPESLDDDVI